MKHNILFLNLLATSALCVFSLGCIEDVTRVDWDVDVDQYVTPDADGFHDADPFPDADLLPVDRGVVPDVPSRRDADLPPVPPEVDAVPPPSIEDAGPREDANPRADVGMGPRIVPSEEVCNGRDDDLDGRMDEGFALTLNREAMVLDEGREVRGQDVSLVPLDDDAYMAIWNRSEGAALPRPFGALVDLSRWRSDPRGRLSAGHRFAHWYPGPGQDVFAVGCGENPRFRLRSGHFDVATGETVRWGVQPNGPACSFGTGAWAGNGHLVGFRFHTEDFTRINALGRMSADGALVDWMLVDDGPSAGGVAVAASPSGAAAVWGGSGRRLHIALADSRAQVFARLDLEGIDARDDSRGTPWSIAPYGDQWMVAVALGGQGDSSGIMVLRVGDDGVMGRYTFAQGRVFNELSLVSQGTAAVLVAQEPNGSTTAWRLAGSTALHELSLEITGHVAVAPTADGALLMNSTPRGADRPATIELRALSCQPE